MIVLFSILFACNRVEPLDSEQICDGLDDDRDGQIDEGLFGYDTELVFDEAGVPNIEQGISRSLRIPMGMFGRSYEAETSEGETWSSWVEFDGEGRAISVEFTHIESDGQETVSLQSAAYEGDLKVWDVGTRTVDGETVLDYEQSWTYHDHGQVSTHSYADTISQRTQDSEWFYDERDREILLRREGSEFDCAEWVTGYDDTLNTKTAYAGVTCGNDPPDTDVITPVEPSLTRLGACWPRCSTLDGLTHAFGLAPCQQAPIRRDRQDQQFGPRQ